MSDPADDDIKKLTEISSELPPLDIKPESAEEIAKLAKQNVGKRPIRRTVEAALVIVLVGSFLVWAVIKVLSAFR